MDIGSTEWTLPIVQVAIDVLTVEEAIEVGHRAVRAKADWLEVGTPLILFTGIPVIGRLAQVFPEATLFADLKVVDGAKKCVVAAAGEGARLVTVCGVATDATIREAVAGGRESGAKVVVDLYATPDPVRRAREVAEMGADLIYLHYGGDQQRADPGGNHTLELIPEVKRAVSLPVGVTTFDVDGGVAAVQAGADIVIIGHPYFTGPDGEATLTEYVQRVKAARPVKAGLEQF